MQQLTFKLIILVTLSKYNNKYSKKLVDFIVSLITLSISAAGSNKVKSIVKIIPNDQN